MMLDAPLAPEADADRALRRPRRASRSSTATCILRCARWPTSSPIMSAHWWDHLQTYGSRRRTA